ncbi:unknown [Choristoneura occidentalis granulovirus]|uniref:Uncharacterized protein n=1 Tax=Choristoneura occidentalis granulovirus TaxID=364745 RepID=Q1A4R4_9BBAC|nr:unknown [Choristoneura fumiferana granulovirus]ABC61166.1 unknown [Choristoneura fumiferana granulovirus]
MSSMDFDLENIVREQNKDIEIYKLAIETLKRNLEFVKQEKNQIIQEQTTERANWCLVDKQLNEVITTLAEQLRNMDNEIKDLNKIKQELHNVKKDLFNQTREMISDKKELLVLSKKNKIYKKKIKQLMLHIVESNDYLDNIICDGDNLIK